MKRYDVYHQDKFGNEPVLPDREDPEGKWYKVEDVDKRIAELEAKLETTDEEEEAFSNGPWAYYAESNRKIKESKQRVEELERWIENRKCIENGALRHCEKRVADAEKYIAELEARCEKLVDETKVTHKSVANKCERIVELEEKINDLKARLQITIYGHDKFDSITIPKGVTIESATIHLEISPTKDVADGGED